MTARVVAVDGPAGSGKSTVSRAVADALGLPTLDTGAMYRCVTLAALEAGSTSTTSTRWSRWPRPRGIDLADGAVVLDGRDVSDAIRGPEVTGAVSAVARRPEVRAVLVARQRAWVDGPRRWRRRRSRHRHRRPARCAGEGVPHRTRRRARSAPTPRRGSGRPRHRRRQRPVGDRRARHAPTRRSDARCARRTRRPTRSSSTRRARSTTSSHDRRVVRASPSSVRGARECTA